MENEISSLIKEKFKTCLIENGYIYNDEFFIIKPEFIKDLLSFLKQNGFEFLMDLFAIDYLGYPQKKYSERFELVYNLYSIKQNKRIFIKTLVDEKKSEVYSVVELFDAANWYEREVFDMYGIRFKGHPNLRRILMYDEFEGHPLRKDYPFNKKQPRIPLREVKE